MILIRELSFVGDDEDAVAVGCGGGGAIADDVEGADLDVAVSVDDVADCEGADSAAPGEEKAVVCALFAASNESFAGAGTTSTCFVDLFCPSGTCSSVTVAASMCSNGSFRSFDSGTADESSSTLVVISISTSSPSST